MRLTGAFLLLLISTTASLAAPNIVVIMTDDQEDTGSMAYMPKTLSLIADDDGNAFSWVKVVRDATRRWHDAAKVCFAEAGSLRVGNLRSYRPLASHGDIVGQCHPLDRKAGWRARFSSRNHYRDIRGR